jgi:hypothetical protein
MSRQLGSQKIRAAYAYLADAERTGKSFTFEELMAGSGWSYETTKANISKKLARFLDQHGDRVKGNGITAFTEDAFCRMCS